MASPNPASGCRPRFSWWLGVLLVLATVVVLGPVLQHDFVAWDDDQHVYTNPRYQPVTWAQVGAFWHDAYLNLYIPLTYTTWAALVWLTRLLWPEPLAATLFHGLNLLLHLGNTLVVYRLARLLLPSGSGVEERAMAGAAASGALLFGLHPLQVEAVAWVSGLKDLLCAWWALVALWQYLESVQAPPGAPQWRRYGLATVAFGLALLAKPAAVVVPLLAWLLATAGLGCGRLQATRALLGWLVLAMLWSYWTKGQQPDTSISYITPWWGRPFVAADAVAFYLWKLVWPVHLGPDYGRSPHLVLGHAWGYLTGLVPLGLGAVLWWRKRWESRAGLALAILVVGLLPVLGWVPFFFQGYSTVADRYVYLALLGPALGLSYGLYHGRRVRALWVVGGLFLVLLGLRSMGQVAVWRDTLSLFTHAVQVNPRSALSHEKIGTALAKQQRFDEAVAYYTEALRLRPRYATAYNNLGLVFTQQEKLAEAAAHFTQALHFQPDLIGAYSNLGLALAKQGKLDEAIAQYRAALALQPEAAEVHYNLGHVLLQQGQPVAAITHYRQAIALKPTWAEAHNSLGNVLDDVGQVTDAITHYQIALAYKPDLTAAHNNLGDALLAQGQLAEASERFRMAVRLQPTWAAARYNLGLALARQGRSQDAMAAFRAALRLRPDWPPAAKNLALALLLQPSLSPQESTEAVALAEQACQDTGYGDATMLYILALAYRAAARQPEAQTTAQQALTLATAVDDTALATQIASQFSLPEPGARYHDHP